jgi:cysteine-rich repeat protein
MKLGCSIGRGPLVAVLAGSLGFVACTEADVEVEYGRAILEIAPATHNATFVGSDLSTQLSPGEKRAVRMTFTNTGVSAPTDNWVVGTHYLRSTNIPLGNWGITNMPLSAGTAVGNNTDVYFRVTVPGPNPNAVFQARMFANFPGSAQDGYFGQTGAVTGINVDSGNTPLWACSAIGGTLPAFMQAGESRAISIEVQNTGSGTWTPGNFCFRSVDSPSNLWGGSTCVTLDATVAPGQNHTFNFTIIAPTNQTGSISFTRQMFGLGGPNNPWGIGYFNDLSNCVTTSVFVNPGSAYDADLVSQNFPVSMLQAGQTSVTVQMQNIGTEAWVNPDFLLYSTNSPTNLWGPVGTAVTGTINPGDTASFTFNIQAPAARGTYAHRWRMRFSGAVGFFGEEINVPVTVVGPCGDGLIDAPETCDDSNTTSGDGCSATCQIEPRVVDTSAEFGDRYFTGVGVDGVHISADLTGDGQSDLVLGQQMSLNATGATRTPYAGAVIGYAGGGAFFGSASTAIPTGATFWVSGAERDDFLGSGQNGTIRSGAVYAGGNSLVVSAVGADGAANARAGAGEVYVFTAASLTGFIDLAANPSAPAATIVGPEAGAAIRILDVGDANADGFDDLLIGAPLASPLGRAQAGEVYLIAGGPSLSGTVDLSTVTAPQLIARFIGQNPTDRLGESGAIGDFTGGNSADVLIGAPNFSAISTRAGAAYSVVGPLSGTYDMGVDYETRWRGGDVASGLGASVAISNVTGDGTFDAVITGNQFLSLATGEPASQRGGVAVAVGPVAAGDLTVNKASNYSAVTAMIFGEDYGDNLGSNLALGDINQDGFSDFFVGAYAADGPGNSRASSGAQYLLVGRQTLPTITELGAGAQAELLIHGPSTPALMGRFRGGATVGDLDSVGGDDFCAANGNGSTRVYCFSSDY